MDYLNFWYVGSTPGHSLNLVATLPALTKAIRAHCRKHKCAPTAIHEACYDFVRERGKGVTCYRVNIEMTDGKVDIAAWIKNNPLPWSFGIPVDTSDFANAREA